jgi:hypothetical protein
VTVLLENLRRRTERRLGAGDLEVLALWVVTRVGLWVVAGAAGWLFPSEGDRVPPLLDRWQQWDFHHYWGIALYGYGGQPTGVPNEAFFPGFPSLLWLGGELGVRHVVTGLAVSFVAGAFAVLALARLADLDGGPGTGRLAVLVWLLAPSAVFLAAPYTEALFLGFAVPAWLAARRDRWAAAGLLAALACTVRVSGVFLVAALAVHWLAASRRRPGDLAWLALAGVPLLAWTAFVRALTGSWTGWLDAQAEGWSRSFTWPWDSFATTWSAAFGGQQSPNFAWMFRAELVAVLVGVVVTVLLLRARRWGEATWVGSQVVAFTTSNWFFSVPRATLLWWPLWIGIAVLAARRRWLLWAYLAVSGPLTVVWSVTYFTGRWSG